MSSSCENRAQHTKNREKVCATCGEKIVFKNKKPSFYHINDAIKNHIVSLVYTNFSLDNPKFPMSICITCRLTLAEHSKKIYNRPLPTFTKNFEKIILRKSTRSNVEECHNCYICEKGRTSVHRLTKKGRGNKKQFSTDLNLKENEQTRKKGKENNSKNIRKMCMLCLQKIGPGIRHPCVRTKKVQKIQENNAISLVKRFPEKGQDRVAVALINSKVTSDNRNLELSLSTAGSKTRILLLPTKIEEPFFSAELLDNYQTKTGASQRDMKILTNLIRCGAGKRSIPEYYQEHSSKKGKLLKDFYKTATMEFDVEQSNVKVSRPVIYSHAPDLLEEVIEKRNIIGNYLVKIMADGGQGFFKISMTVFPENYLKLENNQEDFDDIVEEPMTKRSKYSQGGTVGKAAVITSVYKTVLLCVVPKIKESYDNMKVLFDLIKINEIPFKFVSDFKLLLIVNGQQTATSTCPCPFCFITLEDLRCKENESEKVQEHLKLKTYGDLNNDNEKFCSLNKDKKLARDCHSTINKPLFVEDPDIKVLEKCVIPELHVMQGFVNHLFWDSLVPFLGREKSLLWAKKNKYSYQKL